MPWGESKASIYIDRAFHQKIIAAAKADRRSIGGYVQHYLEPIMKMRAEGLGDP